MLDRKAFLREPASLRYLQDALVSGAVFANKLRLNTGGGHAGRSVIIKEQHSFERMLLTVNCHLSCSLRDGSNWRAMRAAIRYPGQKPSSSLFRSQLPLLHQPAGLRPFPVGWHSPRRTGLSPSGRYRTCQSKPHNNVPPHHSGHAAALTFWSRNPRRWQMAKTRSARFMV